MNYIPLKHYLKINYTEHIRNSSSTYRGPVNQVPATGAGSHSTYVLQLRNTIDILTFMVYMSK